MADPAEVFAAGGTPSLAELRLHNGTIYRWNRPVYDVQDGQPHLRVENRVPGGDVNPYLGISAIIAGGLYGLENELELPDPVTGHAYATGVDTLPTTLRDAADLLDGSTIARAAFGDDVIDHYVHQARIEVEAFDAAVTDWERVRGFERL